MAVSQATLRAYGAKEGHEKSAAMVANAKRAGLQTAFLSHSHKDADLAKGVQGFLKSHGWDVYIDWEDTAMPAVPDRTTANRIRTKIVELDWFLFLATDNSMASRWCPWELGYADGKKVHDRIMIIPTTNSYGVAYGNEYLQLYRQVTDTTDKDFAAFDAGMTIGGKSVRALRP
jgi:hypothetical protein